MKVRYGFVSNSSSSSFIVGIGIIRDEDKVRAVIKDSGIPDYDWMIGTYKDLCNKNEPFYGLCEAGFNKIEIRIPTNSENTIEFNTADVKANTKFLAVCIGNNEGDTPFYNATTEELDYGKAKKIDWYSPGQQKIIKMLQNKAGIVQDSVFEIGAERNG